MPAVFVVTLVLIIAALGFAVGYLMARARAVTALHGSQLELTAAKAELGTTSKQLAALTAQQRTDADTSARLGNLGKTLDDLNRRVIEAEKGRTMAHEQLNTMLRNQAELTRTATEEVQREARKLSKALSRTNVRGLWGEAELRRLVEAAGMLERVHFDTQTTFSTLDANKRPDMIIHLAGGRDIVVDAKVPLDALLEDTGDNSNNYSAEVLRRHAAALKSHIDILAARKYSDLLADTPELVVLYLPAESLLSLALTADAGLLDHAFAKGVALATPTTLLALLRTVNHGWRQEAVAQHAREIHEVGAELHRRLLTMSTHFRRVGKSLDEAVKAFNSTVGSYEGRVLVQARRFESMELVSGAIEEIQPLDSTARGLTVSAIDLTEESRVRAVGR